MTIIINVLPPATKYIYIYIYIYIYVIMSCRQHRYPWLSLATPTYRSSLLAGPRGYIPYPHRAAICRFELAALLLFGHVSGSIGEHRLMSLSLLLQQCPACLVRLTLIVFVMGVGGRTADAFWGVASRTCSKLLAAFLCSCRQSFSPSVYLTSM